MREITDNMVETMRFTLSGYCGFEFSEAIARKALEAVQRVAPEHALSVRLGDLPEIPPANLRLTGWTKVPAEPPLELLKSINVDNQVLAYENGRYYNAWFTYDPGEGGYFWTDDADSEPNPSHYMALPAEPALTAAEDGR